MIVIFSFVLCFTGSRLNQPIRLLQYNGNLTFGKICFHLEIFQLVCTVNPWAVFCILLILIEMVGLGIEIRYALLRFSFFNLILLLFIYLIWEGDQKSPPFPKICHTYPTKIKLGPVIPCLKKIQKKCMNRVTHTSSSAEISIFFQQKSANFAISNNTDVGYILVHNCLFF